MTAVRPSRMSSEERPSFSFLSRLKFLAWRLSVRVSAERKPERWVPPSTVLMLLAKAKRFSV